MKYTGQLGNKNFTQLSDGVEESFQAVLVSIRALEPLIFYPGPTRGWQGWCQPNSGSSVSLDTQIPPDYRTASLARQE